VRAVLHDAIVVEASPVAKGIEVGPALRFRGRGDGFAGEGAAFEVDGAGVSGGELFSRAAAFGSTKCVPRYPSRQEEFQK